MENQAFTRSKNKASCLKFKPEEGLRSSSWFKIFTQFKDMLGIIMTNLNFGAYFLLRLKLKFSVWKELILFTSRQTLSVLGRVHPADCEDDSLHPKWVQSYSLPINIQPELCIPSGWVAGHIRVLASWLSWVFAREGCDQLRLSAILQWRHSLCDSYGFEPRSREEGAAGGSKLQQATRWKPSSRGDFRSSYARF